MLPAVIFLVACLLAFASGTCWGTFGILIPIVVAIFDPQPATLLTIGISACLCRRCHAATTAPPSPIPPSWPPPAPSVTIVEHVCHPDPLCA